MSTAMKCPSWWAVDSDLVTTLGLGRVSRPLSHPIPTLERLAGATILGAQQTPSEEKVGSRKVTGFNWALPSGA